jgi:hypothetical protein
MVTKSTTKWQPKSPASGHPFQGEEAVLELDKTAISAENTMVGL